MFSPCPDQALEPQLSIKDMQLLRSFLGDAIQAHQSIAMLDVGNQRSRLMISEGLHSHPQPVFHHLLIGIDLLAKRTFKGKMPSEAQLEQGIMLAEDAVMPIARLIPSSNLFVTRDPCLLEVARHILGLSNTATAWECVGRLPVLGRDAVEAQFDELARQAVRPHVPRAHLPQSPRWAAALLLLREILHHWQVGAVRLLPNFQPLSAPKG